MSTANVMPGVPEVIDFDYVNLAEVDPNDKPLPEAVYDLKIMKAEMRTAATSGKKYVNMAIAITGESPYKGRRIYERFFGNEFSLKTLRRIQDATGVVQHPGQPMEEWLAELSTVQPEFKGLITAKPDVDRQTGLPRSVDFKGDAAIVNQLSPFKITAA